MKLRDKFSGAEYTAEIFTAPIGNDQTVGTPVELHSPSGDIVMTNISDGTYILTDDEGLRHAIHPSLVGPQFEEVTNG